MWSAVSGAITSKSDVYREEIGCCLCLRSTSQSLQLLVSIISRYSNGKQGVESLNYNTILRTLMASALLAPLCSLLVPPSPRFVSFSGCVLHNNIMHVARLVRFAQVDTVACFELDQINLFQIAVIRYDTYPLTTIHTLPCCSLALRTRQRHYVSTVSNPSMLLRLSTPACPQYWLQQKVGTSMYNTVPQHECVVIVVISQCD